MQSSKVHVVALRLSAQEDGFDLKYNNIWQQSRES